MTKEAGKAIAKEAYDNLCKALSTQLKKPQQDKFIIAEANSCIGYYSNGLQCALWGVKTTEMCKEQLLIFIGFLDRELTQARRAEK